jgi:hypothetical protein
MFGLGLGLWLGNVAATGGGAPPAGVTPTSVGPMASNLGNVTASFGVGAAVGNLCIVATETANQAPGSSIDGITGIVNFGVGTAGAAGATRIDVYYKQSITSGNVSAGITLNDAGDHINAALLTFSGHNTGVAPNWLAAANSATATTTVSMTQSNGAFTDAKAGDILLAVIATDADTDTNLSASSASWSNVTGTGSFVLNDTDSTGTGGGLLIHQLLVTADATNTIGFSCTIDSTIYASVIILIKAA